MLTDTHGTHNTCVFAKPRTVTYGQIRSNWIKEDSTIYNWRGNIAIIMIRICEVYPWTKEHILTYAYTASDIISRETRVSSYITAAGDYKLRTL